MKCGADEEQLENARHENAGKHCEVENTEKAAMESRTLLKR